MPGTDGDAVPDEPSLEEEDDVAEEDEGLEESDIDDSEGFDVVVAPTALRL